jgi:HlyD family secretion protein
MTLALKKNLLAGSLVLLALGLLIYAFMPAPVLVDTAGVGKGRIEVTVEHEGITRVREPYMISAPVSGRITRIEIEPGDPVEAQNTLLAEIKPADPAFLDARSLPAAKADLEAAKAEKDVTAAKVKSARAALNLSKADAARTEALFKKGNIAIKSLDEARANLRIRQGEYETALSALDMAGHQLEAAEARLIQPGNSSPSGKTACCVEVRSPVGGKVLRRLQRSETVVTAGQPLIEVGDPEGLEIVVDLLSTDAVKVRPGDAAYIMGWGGDKPIKARVRLVEPSGFTKVSALGIEEQRVNVILDFDEAKENWRALGDGYRIMGRIIIGNYANVIRVPVGALFREGEDWAVFAVEGGRAHIRKIQLGPRNDDMASVTGGLKEGDSIVLHPGNDLTDGARIKQR